MLVWEQKLDLVLFLSFSLLLIYIFPNYFYLISFKILVLYLLNNHLFNDNHMLQLQQSLIIINLYHNYKRDTKYL